MKHITSTLRSAGTHQLVGVPVQRALLQDKPVSFPIATQEAAALLSAEEPALTVRRAQILDRNPPSTHGCEGTEPIGAS